MLNCSIVKEECIWYIKLNYLCSYIFSRIEHFTYPHKKVNFPHSSNTFNMILRKIRYLNLMKKFNLMFLRILFFFDESQEGILKSSSKKKVFFNKILLRITFITSLQNCIQIESFIILHPTSRPLCQFFPSFFFFVFFFFTFQNETESHGTAVNRAGGFDLFMSLLEGRIFFRFQRVWILIAPFYSLFSDISYCKFV